MRKKLDWKARLRLNYDNSFEQFAAWDEIYNLAHRLGFKSPKEAWEANPIIGGTTDPRDFQVVRP